MRTIGWIFTVWALCGILVAPAWSMGNSAPSPEHIKAQNPSASDSTADKNKKGSENKTLGQKASDLGDAVVSTVNEIGNNDAAQQAAGDIGTAIGKFGEKFNEYNNQLGQAGAPADKVGQFIEKGKKIIGAGNMINKAATAAPFVGELSTAAGYAAEGQYTNAAIKGTNGVGRSLFTGWAGTTAATAGGTWLAGKTGALLGSWAGPFGSAAGFVIGVGTAYLGGKLWDATIGAGADALTQKVENLKAGMAHSGTGPGGVHSEFFGQTIAGETRDITQQQVRDTARDTRPPIIFGGGGGGGGSCGCGGLGDR